LLGNIIRQSGMLDFTNEAVYAQGTYHFNDQWALTAGARYTRDRTQADVQQIVWLFDDNPASGNQHVSDFTLGAPTLMGCANPLLHPANGIALNGFLADNIQPVAGDCTQSIKTTSHAPTWTIDLDYTPVQDILLYAKYSRGYRQGGIVAYATPGLQTYDPE